MSETHAEAAPRAFPEPVIQVVDTHAASPRNERIEKANL